MAKLTNNKVNRSVANQVSNREFSEVCSEVYTVEEFCNMKGVKKIDIRINPKTINDTTGKNNLFMVFGAETGAVAAKVQEGFWNRNEGPERPMIGLMNLEDGSQIYTLFNQGGAETAFSLGLED